MKDGPLVDTVTHDKPLNAFEERILATSSDALRSEGITTVQVNLGLRCNQRCKHCHVQAGPDRDEVMDWATMELILAAGRRLSAARFDLTGGAPELNPHFRQFVKALRDQGHAVQVRTNLTVLLEDGMEDMPGFFRDQQIDLVASLPCYLEENVAAQRGKGVYEKSVEAIRHLNAIGYGSDADKQLDLVYNPSGPFLPSDQVELEGAYREELRKCFDIEFSHLLTITNMPIGRFLAILQRDNQYEQYMKTLRNAFNAQTLDDLMCRHQISIGWDGTLYDCDFNLALGCPVNHGAPDHVRDLDPSALCTRRIVTGDHCFGCTAGAGSSCGGALA